MTELILKSSLADNCLELRTHAPTETVLRSGWATTMSATLKPVYPVIPGDFSGRIHNSAKNKEENVPLYSYPKLAGAKNVLFKKLVFSIFPHSILHDLLNLHSSTSPGPANFPSFMQYWLLGFLQEGG